MLLSIKILMIAGLAWAFRMIRAKRVIAEIVAASKQRTARKVEHKAIPDPDAWMKNATRDTRPPRGRHVYDAPSYTTYTEETGRFQRSETGTFRKLS